MPIVYFFYEGRNILKIRNTYRSNNLADKIFGLAMPHNCTVKPGFGCQVPDRALKNMSKIGVCTGSLRTYSKEGICVWIVCETHDLLEVESIA